MKYIVIFFLLLNTCYAVVWSMHIDMLSKDTEVTSLLDSSKQELEKEYEDIIKIYKKWNNDNSKIFEQNNYSTQSELKKGIVSNLKIIQGLLKTSKSLEIKLIEHEAIR